MLTLAIPPTLTLPSVHNLDGHTWATWSATQRDAFTLGYITATWAWSDSLYVASRTSDLSPDTIYVYNSLSPVSEAQHVWLSNQITQAYATEPPDVEIYKIIHSLVPDWLYQDQSL